MSARPLPPNLSPEEYLELEEKSSVRHEYVDGIVYEMPGESKEHNEVAGNIYTALRPVARSRGCWVAFEGVKLWIPQLHRYYYPDVMVLCDPAETQSHIFQRPCFIVEVTSPTTEATDRREKLQAYRSIESLSTYLIVDPEARCVDVFHRASAGWQTLRLETGSVDVPCLGFSLPLEAIFEGL